MRLLFVLLLLAGCATAPAPAPAPAPDQLDAFKASLAREAAAHGDKCEVKVLDKDGPDYVVQVRCGKVPNVCNIGLLDGQAFILGCVPKGQEV